MTGSGLLRADCAQLQRPVSASTENGCAPAAVSGTEYAYEYTVTAS
jgi:hypothetical protein